MIMTIPKDSKPITPPITSTSATVKIVDIVILFLFFISIVNAELYPDQAESPTDACITIIYFAIISEAIIA